MMHSPIPALFPAILAVVIPLGHGAELWKRHTIDDASKGADGVRLADANGDGRMDIATGWEEGGVVRVYLHPGAKKVKSPWPAVTVGEVTSAEDAVFADLDADGRLDVVSACEGRTQSVFVHWAPTEPEKYSNKSAWTTKAIPCTTGEQKRHWMFCLPMELEGAKHPALVVGSKGSGAGVGLLTSAESPRDLSTWKYRELCKAGWIMSLLAVDVNGDGHRDVLASDRKGPDAQVFWLQNPGSLEGRWTRHTVGCVGSEVMFVDHGDLNGDGRLDVAAAVKPSKIVLLTRQEGEKAAWLSESLTVPADRYGSTKAVKIVDINQDGKPDLAGTCESATGEKSGVFWIQGPEWDAIHDIGGAPGIKYDRIEMLDLDDDGDLDLLTCEERDQLGVHWYENPSR